MRFLGFELDHIKKPLVVAEISCNHGGDLKNVFKLIDDAKDVGCDAVKFQVYTPDELTIKGIVNYNNQDLWDLYDKNLTPREWIPEIFEYAKSVKMPIFSSVYGLDSLRELERHNCPAYKIASFEANDVDFIKRVRDTGKPLVISLGMCNEEDLDNLMGITGFRNTIYLHCVSSYPPLPEEINLEKINTLMCYFKYVGYSDHTMGFLSSELASVMGVVLIEKHLRLSDVDTPDAGFSFDKYGMRIFVKSIIHAMKHYHGVPELDNQSYQYRRRIYAIKDIKQGETLRLGDNVRSVRGPDGIYPSELVNLIHKARTSIGANHPIRKEDIE